MKTYLRILRFARPEAWVVPIYVTLISLHTVFRIINFTALIPVLQILFNTEATSKSVESQPEFAWSDQYFVDTFYYYFGNIIQDEGRLSALYFVCYILLASVLLSNLFQYLGSLIQARVRVDAVSSLREHVFKKVTMQEMGFFTVNRKGDLMSRITTDVQQIEVTVVQTMRVILKEPFLMIGFFFALFRLSPELTLYTLLLIPVSAGSISFIAKRLKRRATRVQESLARISNLLDETISGMRIIKAFTARRYMVRRFAAEVNRYARHNYRMAAKNNLAGPISEFLGVGFLSLILLIGGRLVLSADAPLDAAEFIVFLIIFSQLLNPAKAISTAFSSIQRGIASGERVFEVVDQRPEIIEDPDPLPISGFDRSILFDNVSFAYESSAVLRDINFSIDHGQIVALVGPSGAGKSTIAGLIPRFYDPNEGVVRIDGQDIRAFSINDLRGMMGIVTQESILFNDTIKQNIAFGKLDATYDEVEQAARIANAHDFIVELPDGYDSLVGEQGSKLSGGQRQRISIARAILKNPPILIMDEATSALDSESEKLVQDAIFKLMQNRTTLVIAHRLSTVQHADLILVMEGGRIVERGTHDVLIGQKGPYKKLIEMQSM